MIPAYLLEKPAYTPPKNIESKMNNNFDLFQTMGAIYSEINHASLMISDFSGLEHLVQHELPKRTFESDSGKELFYNPLGLITTIYRLEKAKLEDSEEVYFGFLQVLREQVKGIKPQLSDQLKTELDKLINYYERPLRNPLRMIYEILKPQTKKAKRTNKFEIPSFTIDI